MSPHELINEQVVSAFGPRLADLPRLSHDALELRFDTGLVLQIRYLNADEYSLRWRYQDHALGIDTAPLHPNLSSFPNHLHDRTGRIVADPVTRPGAPVWDNVQAVIARLLDDPWLAES